MSSNTTINKQLVAVKLAEAHMHSAFGSSVLLGLHKDELYMQYDGKLNELFTLLQTAIKNLEQQTR